MRHKITAVAACAAAALAIAGCSSGSSSGSGSSSSSSAAPSELTVWRMGPSAASQVTWMNGVVAEFHKDYPQYKNTKVNVVWVPWANRTTDWTNALTSGKNAPDITELGNTDTPTEASLGALANISNFVDGWSTKPDVVSGMLASTCLAVLFVPSYYVVLQRFAERVRSKKAPPAPPSKGAA